LEKVTEPSKPSMMLEPENVAVGATLVMVSVVEPSR